MWSFDTALDPWSQSPPLAAALPPAAPPSANAPNIARLTARFLADLQVKDQVSVAEFIGETKCDRRQISDIVSVLSTLEIVTVLTGKVVRLNARERLKQPVNLAQIRDATREASEELQRIRIRQFG
jgi:hypothetical protein